MPSLSKLILVMCMAYGGADEDVELLEWFTVVAKAPTSSHRRPMQLAKVLNAPSLRCNPGVQYHEGCKKCVECPECQRFRPEICKCEGIFRCSVGSKNANSKPNVPSVAPSDVPGTVVTTSEMPTKRIITKSTALSKSSTTLVPSTLATSSDITTIIFNTTTISSTTLVPSILATSSDIATTNFNSSTQAPTFGPTATVTPSEIPIRRTTAMSSIIATTIISTQGMHTTNTDITRNMTNRPVTATLVTSSGIPITAATTTKTIKNPATAITSTPPDAGVIDRFQGPFANTFSDAQCEVIDYRNRISLNQCLIVMLLTSMRDTGEDHVSEDLAPSRSLIQQPMKQIQHGRGTLIIQFSAPWLHGGRCGPQHRLPDGRPGQCNPQGIYPCCNTKYGWCGNTKSHCTCTDCINYTKMN